MMKVQELIDLLAKQDPDNNVEVLDDSAVFDVRHTDCYPQTVFILTEAKYKSRFHIGVDEGSGDGTALALFRKNDDGSMTLIASSYEEPTDD
jgi:hypothetical protein